MKKKNLIILLLIPFIIALLGIVTINVSFSTFYGDITSIDWKYNDVEAFDYNISRHALNAVAKNSSDAPLDAGNKLVWKVENKDASIIEPIAEIEVIDGISYLVPRGIGEVIITCSNFKGNVFRKMTAMIYNDGVITIQPVISSSQNNIDSNIYYGNYDLKNGQKVEAEFRFKYNCIPASLNDNLKISHTDNINVKQENNELVVTCMKMISNYDASVTLVSNKISSTYSFKIVDGGINVYTYNDLLACTNKSETGEIVVLRKSFESLKNVNASDANNVELFGNYNSSNNTYSFNNEVYRFDTTFNNEYIKQWNNFAKNNSSFKEISNKVIAGLRVQKDFYGNGYTINMHNLTYPTLVTDVDVDGITYQIPTLSSTDLFRGPLSFYTLGDPNSMPLITSYGQDNMGIYIDGDNITLNDLNLKNCDMGASLQFLDTVGTVVEVAGDNNTIKNCRLQNGKNVVRSFSSNNLLIDNSLLSNAMNFLIATGSNEYVSYDETTLNTFVNDGAPTSSTLLEYLDTSNGEGNTLLNSFLSGTYTNQDLMRESLYSIQNALNDESKIVNEYKGSMVVNDTYFYHSGLASICFETLFNGPFLYSAAPSMITDLFSMLSEESRPIVPYTPTKVSGLSYPVIVEIKGKTKFYDYKNANEIDLSGLIDENISSIASEITGSEKTISIDEIFPLKSILIESAKKPENNSINDSKINIPIAYYGGALNKSKVIMDDLEVKVDLATIEVDFLGEYLSMTSTSTSMMGMMKDIMVKCVTVVTGIEPFKFVCVKGTGYLDGENPNVSDLIANAKEV